MLCGCSWRLKENQLPTKGSSNQGGKRQKGCCTHIPGSLRQVLSNALGTGVGAQMHLASYLGSCHVQINSYDPTVLKRSNALKFCGCFMERILFLRLLAQFLFSLLDLSFGL